MTSSIADAVAERARRRITRRLMPFLFVLYIFNYINRVNIGYAALQMTGDLGFSNAVFGFGAGIFFIGYFLLQIPVDAADRSCGARGISSRISLIALGRLAALCGSHQHGAAVLLDAVLSRRRARPVSFPA